ncbi:hypothetical protein KKF84_09650 [Myxococcota bacterium]|nr:hypothetical protein [Myxococcota bacterium]MBU1535575.1 hypothetical protein [Myxococcota bacterium]
MVSIAKDQKTQREHILVSLFNMESILGYVKGGSQPTDMGCDIISRALEKIYSTFFTTDWENSAMKMRALNMAIRGILYDIMDDDFENLEIFEEMLGYSKDLDQHLAWI